MKTAEKCRVRTAINDEGDIVLYGSELGDIITETGAENLISMITTAKQDSKEIKAALKKIGLIKKQYNSIGKPLEPDNLREIPEGPAPEGVIDES